MYRPGYRVRRKAAFPGSNAAHFPAAGVVAPSSLLRFAADNINLLGNVGILDADPIGTYKNLGSVGAAGDMVQAAAPNRPIFRLVAASGKINNMPALESGGTQFMASPVFTALTQPLLIGCVFKVASLAAVNTVFDGGTGGVAATNISVLNASGVIQLFSGSAVATQAIPAATWETYIGKFNGVTSFGRLNGSQSGNVNAGATSCVGASIFAFNGGTVMTGMQAELMVCDAAVVAPTDIEAYFAAKYGVNPQ